jgi:hypothetical protein
VTLCQYLKTLYPDICINVEVDLPPVSLSSVREAAEKKDARGRASKGKKAEG